ncbi:glutamate--tRNA ligase [Sulfuriroseicoccus oceanibius]|uniref:Glutamate--tRNA ligase n=1 Tax=Sulfuriroseicoccus oceanibius TaxID=2707525 RepID=A0A6B3L5Z2_9BACT|nr:glutamate--tRNA ligase family protein [Sulfuriroseicoccus oceanibius]QQL46030.1 glutamate--tRNA ligase [Sulfuriroseicoccus oceanibius]
MIRTRFAPSPTGYLHVGGARTALFNWLYARKHGAEGKFILRVEDTDDERNTEEAFAAIFEGMAWLGLDWDEGPDKGGDYGPYCQSQRKEIYDRYFEKLVEAGRVYEDEGAWRFRFKREPITVHDEVAGDVTIDYRDTSNTPDMVVKRSNGGYVFHFVNVVDDIEMKITHVIRGDDHLSNTHKHVQLYEAFGVEPPIFAHTPLILNDNGSKMSKRDEGASVRSYIEGGFLPEAVINFLSLLGWSPKIEDEVLPLSEIVERFGFDGINRKSAVFDLDKCRWFNQQYLQQADAAKVLDLILPALESAGIPTDDRDLLISILDLVREKVRLTSELPEWFGYFFGSTATLADDAKAKAFGKEGQLETAAAIVGALESIDATEWDADHIKPALNALAGELGTKMGKLMFPLRVLTTGKAGGPDLMPLIEILGKETTLARAISVLEQAKG